MILKRIYLPIIFLLLFYLIFTNRYDQNIDIVNNNEKDFIFVNVNGNKTRMTKNEYIFGVLSCEVPALFEEEALKSMVVAINSFYLYKININPNYVPTNTEQCYISSEELINKWGEHYDLYSSKLKQIISSVNNEYIFYDGKVIEAFYFSLSNGYTEDADNVFNEKRDYLVSKESKWDLNVKNFEYTVTFTETELLDALNIEDDIVFDFRIISRNKTNRVEKVKINNLYFSGLEIRTLLNLRSTDFEIIENSNSYNIITKGYGHGVGLSQYGANEMAKNGYNYKEILQYYYNNTTVEYYV